MKQECDSCEYKTEVKPYKSGHPRQELNLCDICASTHISSQAFYPTQHSHDGMVLKTIGYVANLLLDEIRKNR